VPSTLNLVASPSVLGQSLSRIADLARLAMRGYHHPGGRHRGTLIPHADADSGAAGALRVAVICPSLR